MTASPRSLAPRRRRYPPRCPTRASAPWPLSLPSWWSCSSWAVTSQSRVRARRHPTSALRAGWFTRLDTVAVAMVVLTGTALATPAAYYYHYAAFFGPFLALMLGLAAGRIALLSPATVAVLTVAVLLAGAVHAVHVVRVQPRWPAGRGPYPPFRARRRLRIGR